MKLLSVENDAKTIKGKKVGILTGVLYGAPAKTVNAYLKAHLKSTTAVNLCPASGDCERFCIYKTGRGGMMPNVAPARIARTVFMIEDREGFKLQLCQEIISLYRKAYRNSLTPAVRFSGTFDYPIEKMTLGKQAAQFMNDKGGHRWPNNHVDFRPEDRILDVFFNIQFYDYTKIAHRMWKFIRGQLPSNYHLTFSMAEDNSQECEKIMRAGGNVAVAIGPDERFPRQLLFATPDGEETPLFCKFINGDEYDARFLDDKGLGMTTGALIVLKYKRAFNDETGRVKAIPPVVGEDEFIKSVRPSGRLVVSDKAWRA